VGQDVLVKITTVDGTFNEAGFTYEGEGNGGVVTPPPTVTRVYDSATPFSSVTAGDLIVVIANTRNGDTTTGADTYTASASGYTTELVASYRTGDGNRRAVAILTKIAVGTESGAVSVTWGGATSCTTYATIYQVFTGATTYTAGNSGTAGSNDAEVASIVIPGTALADPGTENILTIGATVIRDNPGTVGMTNLDYQVSAVSGGCYSTSEFSYGAAVTETTVTLSAQRISGLLIQFACS